MQFCAVNTLLALCFLVSLTVELCTSPGTSQECLRDQYTQQITRRKLIKRRLVAVTLPRLVILPVFGPANFRNVFSWGVDPADQENPVDSETKHIAAQALSSVLESYYEQHPSTATQYVKDMHEVFLMETNKLPSSQEKDIPKAREDLVNFFSQHDDLQTDVELKFADLYTNRASQPNLSKTDELDNSSNDWAHINPNDD